MFGGVIFLLIGGVYVFFKHESGMPESLSIGNTAGLSARQKSLLQQPALSADSEITKLVVRKRVVKRSEKGEPGNSLCAICLKNIGNLKKTAEGGDTCLGCFFLQRSQLVIYNKNLYRMVQEIPPKLDFP